MSDVDFDPENGSRMVQLARGVINRSFVQPLRDQISVMIPPIRHYEESEENHNRIAVKCKCSMKCKTTLNATQYEMQDYTKCNPRSLLDPLFLFKVW